MKFNWSNRNLVEGKWNVFYYSQGMGMATGSKVYYGKSLWNTESQAIKEQENWENRISGISYIAQTLNSKIYTSV